jgi:hypothetical protein
VFHQALSSAALWWAILNSGDSTCSVLNDLIAQISSPIKKKALGGNSSNPFA